MSKPTRIAVLILTVGIAVPAVFAEPPAKKPVPLSEGKKARHERQEKEREAEKNRAAPGSGVMEFRRQADTDKNGKLSPAEREAAEKAAKEKRELTRVKIDTNGDGKISPEEWRAADPDGLTFEAHMSERIKTMSEAEQAALVKRWDKNADGTIDAAEKAAWQEQWQSERMALLARFDADNDGKLNSDERKAMVEALKAERQEKKEEKKMEKPAGTSSPAIPASGTDKK